MITTGCCAWGFSQAFTVIFETSRPSVPSGFPFSNRTEVYRQFGSKCDSFFRSEGSCGRNKTLHSSIFCATILSFPPRSLTLSCFLALHPQESTPLPPLPPLPDPGQYDLAGFTGGFLCCRCRLGSAARRNGDSLDSRVRPRADQLHPRRSVIALYYQTSPFFFLSTILKRSNAEPRKGLKEEIFPLDKHFWVRITSE